MSATWNTIKDYNTYPFRSRKIKEHLAKPKPEVKCSKYGNEKWHALGD